MLPCDRLRVKMVEVVGMESEPAIDVRRRREGASAVSGCTAELGDRGAGDEGPG